MTSVIDISNAFVLLVVVLSYVPVLRAYAIDRESRWLVAGHTALLVGRTAAVVWPFGPSGRVLVEQGVGVALAGALVAMHVYEEWSDDTGASRSEHETRMQSRSD